MANKAPDAAESNAGKERLPAVWPWLLIPLVALALYFTLRTVREGPARTSAAAAPTIASPSDDTSPTSVR